MEKFILEENDSIHKESDGSNATEYEVKEAITFLECRLMDALSRMETINAKMKAINARMKALKEGLKERRCSVSTRDREARI
ncbi:MAG: hypothetical protein Q8830_03030 [Candidatus Phytoplasma australasiaticum]|nr:hypothetical protein [Candidatus Phytoplasma australasiaticum]